MEQGYEERLKKLFVGGLNLETTDETLKEYFEAYGKLEDSVVVRDQATGISRGFGYLTFADYHCTFPVLQDKKAAVHKIDNKQVDVKRAIPRDDSSTASLSKTKKIFIGGLKRDAEENDIIEEIERILKGFGRIVSVNLIKDKESGECRGFGFIELDSEDSVDTLCCVKKINIKGKSAEIKKAEPQNRDSIGGQGRGRGRRQNGRFDTNGLGTQLFGNVGAVHNPKASRFWTAAVGGTAPFGGFGASGGTFHSGAAYGGYPAMNGQMATRFGPLRTGYGTRGQCINVTASARTLCPGGRGAIGGRYKPY